MILPGSYGNGFAPRDGRPLYPELHRRLIGNWSPCLGPTGSTLRDWSGFGNHGTLTNGPTWTASQGRYAITGDGTDDYIECGTSSLTSFGNTSDFSVSCWFFATATGAERGLITRVNSSDQGWALTISSGTVRFPAWHAGPSIAITTNRVYHVCAVNRSGTREIWLDGTLAASAATGTITANTINTVIGRYYGNFAGFSHAGWIDGAKIHGRALAAGEIKLLASRRGIAEELAPRRRASVAVQFNRRRRLLVGAGS
jgi:hypothetical protein